MSGAASESTLREAISRVARPTSAHFKRLRHVNLDTLAEVDEHQSTDWSETSVV